MNLSARMFVRLLTLAVLACSSVSSAWSQQFPTKPVRLLVPFPPGGSTDVTARLIAQKLSESLGGPVVVENRPGANTIIATEAVARSDPDGHTLLLTTDQTVTMNQFLYAKLPYDPEKDLVPVSLVSTYSMVIAASESLPVNTLADLIAYAKSKPDQLNFGSGAVNGNIVLELLKEATGIRLVYVPYKGGGPALQALRTSSIELAISEPSSFLPLIKEGKAKPLAITGPTRVPELPDTPTLAELGYRSAEMGLWRAIFVAAGTPPQIVDRLNREIVKVIAMPDVSARIRSMGIAPASSTPTEVVTMQRADAARWGRVIKSASIRAD